MTNRTFATLLWYAPYATLCVLTDLEAWVFGGIGAVSTTPLDPRLWRKLQSAVVASTSLELFAFSAHFDATHKPTASQAFDGLAAAVDPDGRLYKRDPKQIVKAACEFMGVPTPHRCGDAKVHVQVYLQMCKQSDDANQSIFEACKAKGIGWY